MIDDYTISAKDFENAERGDTVRIRNNGAEFVLLSAEQLHDLEHQLNFLQLVIERKADIKKGNFYTLEEFKKVVAEDIKEIKTRHGEL